MIPYLVYYLTSVQKKLGKNKVDDAKVNIFYKPV